MNLFYELPDLYSETSLSSSQIFNVLLNFNLKTVMNMNTSTNTKDEIWLENAILSILQFFFFFCFSKVINLILFQNGWQNEHLSMLTSFIIDSELFSVQVMASTIARYSWKMSAKKCYSATVLKYICISFYIKFIFWAITVNNWYAILL